MRVVWRSDPSLSWLTGGIHGLQAVTSFVKAEFSIVPEGGLRMVGRESSRGLVSEKNLLPEQPVSPRDRWRQSIETRLIALLEKRTCWCLMLLTAGYVVVTADRARTKPYWDDELCTYYVASLPRIQDIWSILATGFEQLPPMMHLLIRCCHGALGDSPISTRLPAMVGFWLLCLSLFVFVRRRLPVIYAFTAAVIPCASGAYYYATEARPYGVVLGACGIALICWQKTTMTPRRWGSLVGLTLALAVANCSHYFASLMVPCLALGELVRSRTLKRLDWPVWLALLAGLSVIFGFLPLMHAARAAMPFRGLWVEPLSLLSTLKQLYGPFLNIHVPAIVLAGIVLWLLTRGGNAEWFRLGNSVVDTPVPAHEIVAFGSLVSLPFCLALASFAGILPFARYVIISILGTSVLIVLVLQSTLTPRACLYVLILLIVCFPINARLAKGVDYPQSLVLSSSEISNETELPVVVQDATLLTAFYYGSPDLRNRLYHIRNTEETHLWSDDLARLGAWIPIKVPSYNEFVSSHDRAILEISEEHVKLLKRLIRDGARIELKEFGGGRCLCLVTMPAVH